MPPSWLVTIFMFDLGLVFVFAGERLGQTGAPRTVLTGIGILLIVAAAGLRVLRLRGAQGEKRRVESAILGLYAVGGAGLLMYFAGSDLFTSMGGKVLSADSPKLAGVLSALWPCLMLLSMLTSFLMELAYASMQRSDKVEIARVRDAMLSGLGLSAVVIFGFCLMYVFNIRDARWDLAYFRTAKASEATKKIVAALDEPVKVSTFFPRANEVGDSVDEYFDDLKKESPKLEVNRYDQALDPGKARELGVSANGAIVVARGARKETMLIGTELDKARGQLLGLDAEIQKRLLVVARQKKPLYFTIGHGERTDEAVSATDQRATVAVLKTALKDLNYDLKPLGVEQGLGADVPSDAAAVLVLGPTEDFSKPEAESMARYLARGGRMLIALDPEAGKKQEDLLTPLGLEFVPTILASDKAYAPIHYQPSDRTNIGTNTYSSHPSVTLLSRSEQPLFMFGAGYLNEAKAHPAELSVDFSVRAHSTTWDDQNNNYQFDPPTETRKAWPIVAAVTRRNPKGVTKPEEEGRAIVMADSDALADQVLGRAPGNGAFATDAVKWLLGDEAISGTANTENDIPLTRTKAQDEAWFYGSMFLAPGAVMALGYAVSRRRGKRAPRPSARGGKS